MAPRTRRVATAVCAGLSTRPDAAGGGGTRSGAATAHIADVSTPRASPSIVRERPGTDAVPRPMDMGGAGRSVWKVHAVNSPQCGHAVRAFSHTRRACAGEGRPAGGADGLPDQGPRGPGRGASPGCGRSRLAHLHPGAVRRVTAVVAACVEDGHDGAAVGFVDPEEAAARQWPAREESEDAHGCTWPGLPPCRSRGTTSRASIDPANPQPIAGSRDWAQSAVYCRARCASRYAADTLRPQSCPS
jgi:hypothetical protein